MNPNRAALITGVTGITGITGQEGAYLAELLLDKGSMMHGIKRRASLFNAQRIDHLDQHPHESATPSVRHQGDLTDKPQPHPPGAAGAARRDLHPGRAKPRSGGLRAARVHRQRQRQRHRCAAPAPGHPTARPGEVYRRLPGQYLRVVRPVAGGPGARKHLLLPPKPLCGAKLCAYWITANYRQAYALHASNGILFNHESPLRGETFVTRKITRAMARIALGLQDDLYQGNLSALRDGGHARDYVQAMWLMLQQEQPDDYVVATGQQHSVREFVQLAAARRFGRIYTVGVGVFWTGPQEYYDSTSWRGIRESDGGPS